MLGFIEEQNWKITSKDLEAGSQFQGLGAEWLNQASREGKGAGHRKNLPPLYLEEEELYQGEEGREALPREISRPGNFQAHGFFLDLLGGGI